MPLQFRRGPDSDRLTITPVVAEPVFTTDTKKLFIGDGSTAGGIEIQGSVDSAATIALIDSAYVQARSPLTTTADFPDSAGVNTLIDARVNASFINALTIDADTLGGQAASTYLQTTADFPDSAGVNSLIDTRVNATFINNLTIDADTLGGQAGSHYLNYNNFTNTPTIPTLGTSFVDSAEARELISVTDAGGDGSLAYNNSTGVLTYTGPSAAEVRAHFSGGTGVTYTSGTGAIAIGQAVGTTDSVTFGGLYVSGNLMVNGTTTTINSTTLTVDDKNIVLADGAANANAADSGGITVAGANAQLFYKSTTDAWNFNKDLAMGGNDVSGVGRLTATGAISTTDSAVFGGNGSTGGVKIDDGAITIRTGTGSVAAVDFYCEVNNAHRVRLKSPAHANYSGNPDVVLPTSSGTLALTSQIPTNNNTLTNGAGYITASSTETLTNKSGNISMFTNDANYLDSTYATALVDSAYVQARVTAGTDSAATISLISATVDSAYVQLRQSGGAITVQEEGVSLATSATTLNFVGSNVTASGTGATKTITITGGSGGAGGSGISRADFFHYTATNGQTSFTGADDDGQTLSYTPARAAVYLNGILLRDSADYTSTSGDAIVLGTGADSNDIITIINQGGLDSSLVTGIVDSAYVAARAGGATGGTDSAAVIALIDSAYIQLRQSNGFSAGTVDAILVDGNSASDTTYESAFWTAGSDSSGDGYNQGGGLTWTSSDGKVTVSEGGLYEITFHAYLTASGGEANHNQRFQLWINGSNKIPAFINKYMPTSHTSTQTGHVVLPLSAGDYIQVRGAGGSSYRPRIYGGSGHTYLQVIKQENGVLDTGIDSSTITSLIDSDYIQLRQSAAGGGTDSAAVLALIDSAHITSKIGSAATLTFTPDVKHARLSMSGDETIDAGAWRKVDNLTVRDVDTSTGNALSDTSNARLVIPAGVTKVKLMAGLETTDVAGQVIAEIYHYNSSGVQQSSTKSAKNDTDTSGGDTTVTYTSIIDVSQGDYFQLHAYAQDAGTLKATAHTYLEIEVLEGSILNTVIGSTIQLSDLSNVHTATPTNGQALVWDSANQYWEPGTVASSGGSGGTDSAAVIALIDSSYVQARQSATAPVTVTADIFSYTATANQTGFTGADNNNKTLAYTPDNVNVFLNGILLVDSDDYTATGGSVITLQSAASAGDNIQITGYSTTGAARETAFSTFTYTADSGQTAFAGASEEGTSLQYTSRAQVYLNGILLKDSDDYTRTSSSTLTLTEAADSSDIIQIHDFSDVRVSSNLINKNYEYTADSGQTTFSGADNNSATLSYQSGYIQVFLNGILLREADYTANNGSSVVLAEAADSGNTLTISKYGYGTTNPSTVATWTERSTTATAVAGEKLFIDCSSGVVTVTLPSSPEMGSEIRVIDATGNAATNNITIGRNGSKINGADSDLTLDVNRAAIGLVYYNAAQGWILMER